MMMNNNSINVVPSPIVQETKYVTRFKFNIIKFTPFKSVDFRCTLFSQNNEFIETEFIFLEKCENLSF
jgi:hypothetical protein